MIVRVDNSIGYMLDDGSIQLMGSNKIVKAVYSVINVKDYGDNKTEKICNLCHEIKPVEEFQKNQTGKGDRQIRRPSCNDCRRKIDGIGMDHNDKKQWKKPYLEPFTCPICIKTTIPGLTSKVVLNHDHKTGKITGWICDSCNTGLGRFKDDQRILLNAVEYLNKFLLAPPGV